MPTALIYGQEGWGTKIKAYNGEIKESFSGGRVDVDGINKENMMYEYELMRSKVRYYIYFKKNIGTNENPKYKTLDSLIIYRNKLPKDQNTIDMFAGLTDKQILLFAKKLAHDDAFAGRIAKAGESYDDLEKRLINLLVDPRNQQKWADDLKRLGFNA